MMFYDFSNNGYLAFNIHYHEGDDVIYLADDDWSRNREGYAAAPVAQDYCLMWTNNSPDDIRLNYSYEITEPPEKPEEKKPAAAIYGPFLPDKD